VKLNDCRDLDDYVDFTILDLEKPIGALFDQRFPEHPLLTIGNLLVSNN